MHEHAKFLAAATKDMHSDTESDRGRGSSSLSGSRDGPNAAGIRELPSRP